MKESGLRLRVPTAPLIVSSARPVNCWLTTVTELAPFPVKVMLCALGPKVICAANAPDAHRGGPIATRRSGRQTSGAPDLCSAPRPELLVEPVPPASEGGLGRSQAPHPNRVWSAYRFRIGAGKTGSTIFCGRKVRLSLAEEGLEYVSRVC